MIHVDSVRLAPLMRHALSARDVDQAAIDHVVASLVQTSLRGVDSHGINLFPHYCRAVDAGRINRHPSIKIDNTAAGTTVLDGDYGFGHHVGAVAIDTAVSRAADTGIAAVAVRHTSHFGAAAYFGLRAADRGCIGFAFTNADALVRAHNSLEHFFGTNPVCCCAPMADEDPFSLDMTTSLANWNKVNEARRVGRSIPADWAYDEHGNPVTDPNAAYSLAPAAGYKGFGLGMMVDILCALLTGGAFSKDIPGMYTTPLDVRRDLSHFFMAIDIGKFIPLDVFRRRLQEMADRIRALPRASRRRCRSHGLRRSRETDGCDPQGARNPGGSGQVLGVHRHLRRFRTGPHSAMTVLVDVVNFNSDASCLDTERWLRAMAGGPDSEVCRWLRLYVDLGKPVVLGMTGATLADLSTCNPEALELIRTNPATFEGVLRPFSHDIALLRSPHAFGVNLRLGARAVRRHFSRSSHAYLPPEFMLSNEHIGLLAQNGVESVFVNADRLSEALRLRIPAEPYWVRGLGQTRLQCVPVAGDLTQHYLDALHNFDASGWNAALASHDGSIVISWRDGESSFLLPDGLEREACWLAGEAGIERRLLDDIAFTYRPNDGLDAGHLRSYPVHSFLAWMREFRMLGYLGRLQRFEDVVQELTPTELTLWLQAINSDVLSAVEKRSPVVTLRSGPGSASETEYTLLRSERGFEGDECLRLLELSRLGRLRPLDELKATNEPYATKLRARVAYLERWAHEGVGD